MIDVKNLESGVYFVKINTLEGKVGGMQKIIKL
jgi:hypothetical protein